MVEVMLKCHRVASIGKSALSAFDKIAAMLSESLPGSRAISQAGHPCAGSRRIRAGRRIVLSRLKGDLRDLRTKCTKCSLRTLFTIACHAANNSFFSILILIGLSGWLGQP
jgi:hypothetical protein